MRRMETLINKIKEYMSNMDNRKFINKLLIILTLTIFLLVLINGSISPKKDKGSKVINPDLKEYNSEVQLDYSMFLEKRLTSILGELDGVGKVNVMITLDDSSEKVPAANTTKSTETTSESDSEGGTRKIIREDENIQLVNTSGDIVVLKEINPNIKGVIVVAEGAEDGEVLESIYEAVTTVLGVASNKVQVFKSK